MLETRQLLSVPAAPTTLSALPSSSGINLSWADNSSNETGFVIERATNAAFTLNTGSTTVGANVTTCTVSGLSPATTYYFRAHAYNGDGSSSNTSNARAVTTTSSGTFILDPDSTISGGTWPSYTYTNLKKDTHQPTEPSMQYYAQAIQGDKNWTSEVGLYTAALPTGTTVSSLTVWVYSGCDGIAGKDGDTINWNLRIGGTLQTAQAQTVSLNDSWSSFTWNGLSASQSDLDGMQVWANVVHANQKITYVYQVYAEATYTILPPTNLSATAASQTQIDLSWTDNSSNETGFYIDRATDSTFTTGLATSSVGANATTYSATGLASNTTYYFRVRAYNATDTSSNTATVSTNTLDSIPAAPSYADYVYEELSGQEVGKFGVYLTWTDNSDNETGFLLQRATSSDFTENLATSNLGPNQDGIRPSGLVPGTTYYFRICAVGTAGNSPWSDTLCVQIPWPIPHAPSDLTATTVSQTQISITWTEDSSNVGGFDIYRGITPNLVRYFVTVDGDARSYVATGLSAGTTYYFRLSAWNSSGVSSASLPASATTVLPDITATPTTGGDPWADTPGNVAFGLDGGRPMDLSYSGGAMRYGDGREFYTTSDIAPAEVGLLSGLTRTWSSDPQRSGINQGLGSGWFMSQWPLLVQSDTSIKAVDGGTSIRWFDLSGGNYVQRFFGRDKLVQGNDYFYLTDTAGNCTKYFRFDYSITAQRGMPYQYIDAAGNVTEFHYVQDKLDSIVRRIGSAGQILENTSLIWSGDKVQSAAVTRYDANGQAHAAAAAVYGYTGELLTHVTIYGTEGQIIDQKQYWYDANGHLSTVLEGDSYQRVVGANVVDPTSAAEYQVAPYADLHFAFEAGGHLTQQIMQGSGQYDYTYFASSFDDGINNWRYRTTEYLPDGLDDGLANNDRWVVYSNYAGEVLATVFQDYNASGVLGQQWITAYKYDSNGRLILQAEPSAISGAVNDANADIVTPILSTSTGLVHVMHYYDSGAAIGYLQYVGVEHGNAPATLSKTLEYVYNESGTGAALPICGTLLVSRQTQYVGELGTMGVDTLYSYQFYPGTDAVSQRTTTLPAVAEAQNGADTTATEIEQYDSLGHLRWTKDADGFISYLAYDQATGALTRSIVDVNTAQTGDFQSLPGGWTTPSGGGLHLKTDFLVDALGRVRQITDPNGHITTVTYTETEAWTEIRTRYPDAGSGMASPPDEIVRHDRTVGVVATLTVAHGATGTTDVLSLAMSVYNIQGQLAAVQRYYGLNGMQYAQLGGFSAIMGASSYRTEYYYDAQGRQEMVIAGRDRYVDSIAATNPTITKTVYDALGRTASTWIGTTDTNLVEVSENEYDDPADTLTGGGVGDSTLTKVTLFPGGIEANRVTRNLYDWRDQVVASKSGVETTEDPSVNRPLTVYTYDNLGRTTSVAVYDGDGVALSASPAQANRRAYSETKYDDRGRVYCTLTDDVDQALGTGMNALATDLWYNNRDQAIKTRVPGGLVTKAQYDGAGRVTKQSTTDGGQDPNPGATGNYAAADDLDGDAVLEQMLYQYDQNGNVRLVTTKQRNHDSTVLGDLSDGDARISFVGNWYDGTDRLVGTVNYGNNGNNQVANNSTGRDIADDLVQSSPPGIDSTAVNGWDRWLVSTNQYDAAGNLAITVDPRNIWTRTYYDALGRKIWVIEAYTGTLATSDPQDTSLVPGRDTNRKSFYCYNGFDAITAQGTVTYKNSSSPPQTTTTTYTYGVTAGGAYALNNSGLLLQASYGVIPDSTDPMHQLQDGDDTETVLGYNALGEVTKQLARNGTTHEYAYDVVGRQTRDAWTATEEFAQEQIVDLANVGQVSYDALGRGVLFTMLAASTPLNQVQRVYDGLGHLVTEYQEHDGIVDTGTSAKVQYVYDTSYANADNYSRLTQVVYPNGRITGYAYGYDAWPINADRPEVASFLDALNDHISRVGYIGDTASPGGSNQIETYDYLGLSQLVARDMPNSRGSLRQSYIATGYLDGEYPGASIGQGYNGFAAHDDAGASDPYDGLDRFGRVVDQGYGAREERIYAYDADGNTLYARVATANVDEKWKSEIYHLQGANAWTAYDKLNRMMGYYRGVMQTNENTVDQTDIYCTPTQLVPTQYLAAILYDVQDDGTAGQTSGQTSDLARSTTYQKALPDPTTQFDLAEPFSGNRRDMFLTFDAWGQLTQQSQAYLVYSGTGTQYHYDYGYQTGYQYDALGRRISETVKNRFALGGNDSETYTQYLYYDASGNIIEEQREQYESTTITAQYIWSPVAGVLTLRDANRDGDAYSGDYGMSGSGLEERTWALTGADGTVWEIQNQETSGAYGIEQFVYTPAGEVTLLHYDSWNYVWTFGINSYWGWHNFWHGGQAGMDQAVKADRTPESGPFLDMLDGTLLLPGGQTYDTFAQTPLHQDKYAFFRTNADPIDQFQYSHRSQMTVAYGFNGYAGTNLPWQDLDIQVKWQALQTAVTGMSLGVSLIMGSAVGGLAGSLASSASIFADAPILGGAFGAMVGGFAGGYSASMTASLANSYGLAQPMNWGEANQQALHAGALGGMLGGAFYGAGVAFNATRAMGQALGNSGWAVNANGELAWTWEAIGQVTAGLTPALAGAMGGAIGGAYGGYQAPNASFSLIRGPLSAEGRRYGGISNTSPYRAGVSRTPRHHWLPQRDRAFFKARDISDAEIDRLTSPMTQGFHEAIEKYVGGAGGYRNTLMDNILRQEARYGRMLTRREVLQEVAALRRGIKMSGYKVIDYNAP